MKWWNYYDVFRNSGLPYPVLISMVGSGLWKFFGYETLILLLFYADLLFN